MSNITEWLANLPWYTVVATIIVLIVARFALLKRGTPSAKSMAEVAESLAIAMGLVFLIIRPFFVQAFFIPSESMVPTLLIHDHILVNKAVYRVRDPQHGDIVVFNAPPAALEASGILEPKQIDYIKRLIGVPGDEIYVVPGYVLVDGVKFSRLDIEQQIAKKTGYIYYDNSGNPRDDLSVKLAKDGVYVDGKRISSKELADYLDRVNPEIEIHPGYVWRNGKILNEPYTAEDPDSAYPDLSDARTNLPKMIAEGKLKLIQNKGHERIKLSKGEYLMMGDNRNHSSDGRFWGPLDRDRVVGRAMFTFFPFGRFQWDR
ncbi:MAG: signal peptidase I [Armatimonadota bacterium]